MDERLKKQLAFALEIDKEKEVYRQTSISGGRRKENDAEHAWHMAIMAYLLKEYSNEEIDICKVMIMCLIHDIVEIDAGDTYAAKERIYSLLPEDQREEMITLFDEFEAGLTAESKFAHAMDNLQPLMLNDSNDGGDWKEHDARSEAVYKRHEMTRRGSEKLYEVTDMIIRENIKKGNLK